MAKNDNLTDFLTDVANAIREKEKSTGVINPQDFSDRILAIKGAEEKVSVPWKDVNFVDYDGTVLYSYNMSELQLSGGKYYLTVPPLPSHDGLICQRWNCEADPGTQIEVFKGEIFGANYITDNGETRFYIRTNFDNDRARVSFHASTSTANSVSIDWGDGSPLSYNNTNNNYNDLTHTYVTKGDYVIKIMPKDDVFFVLSYLSLLNMPCFSIAQNNGNRWESSNLKKVELGKNVTLGSYAFAGQRDLETITVPTTNFRLSGYSSDRIGTFKNASSLKCFVFPEYNAYCRSYTDYFNGCTSLKVITTGRMLYEGWGSYFAYNCKALEYAYVPCSWIGSYAFWGCSSLRKVTISNNISSISDMTAFSYCESLELIDLTAVSGYPSLGEVWEEDMDNLYFPCNYIVVQDGNIWLEEEPNWCDYSYEIVAKSKFDKPWLL